MKNIEYRLFVTEIGNENAHCIDCRAKTDEGAKRSLINALRPYGGDGYGWIEYRFEGEGREMWRELS
jgi:hypothetical protein